MFLSRARSWCHLVAAQSSRQKRYCEGSTKRDAIASNHILGHARALFFPPNNKTTALLLLKAVSSVLIELGGILQKPKRSVGGPTNSHRIVEDDHLVAQIPETEINYALSIRGQDCLIVCQAIRIIRILAHA